MAESHTAGDHARFRDRLGGGGNRPISTSPEPRRYTIPPRFGYPQIQSARFFLSARNHSPRNRAFASEARRAIHKTPGALFTLENRSHERTQHRHAFASGHYRRVHHLAIARQDHDAALLDLGEYP